MIFNSGGQSHIFSVYVLQVSAGRYYRLLLTRVQPSCQISANRYQLFTKIHTPVKKVFMVISTVYVTYMSIIKRPAAYYVYDRNGDM